MNDGRFGPRGTDARSHEEGAGQPQARAGLLTPRLRERAGVIAVETGLIDQRHRPLPHLRINAADPGFTKTDLNGNAGTQTVAEGAEVVVRLAQVGPDGPTGGLFNTAGSVPW